MKKEKKKRVCRIKEVFNLHNNYYKHKKFLVREMLAGLFLFAWSSQSYSLRVTCVGDSITEGGACVSTSYTYNLQNLFGDNAIVTNAGVSAQTMLKHGLCNDLSPCSYWNTNAWQNALQSKPDIVTIMLGTNDAKAFNWEGIQQNLGDYYTLDYVDMIKQLRQLDPKPEIYVLVPPPLYEPYPWEMNATVINEIFPVVIKDLSTVTETGIISVYDAFREAEKDYTENLTCDGCHPTADGNQVIAEAIYNAITLKHKF